MQWRGKDAGRAEGKGKRGGNHSDDARCRESFNADLTRARMTGYSSFGCWTIVGRVRLLNFDKPLAALALGLALASWPWRPPRLYTSTCHLLVLSPHWRPNEGFR